LAIFCSVVLMLRADVVHSARTNPASYATSDRRYLAHGTGTDYMYEVLGVPMSFTWEIYGDEKATFEDCFRMFNPLGKQQFDQVVNMWVKALLLLFELLPTHPATGPVFRNVPLAKEDAAAAAAAAEADAEGGAAALPVAAKAAPPSAVTQQEPQELEQEKDSGQREDGDKQKQEEQQQQQPEDGVSKAPASASDAGPAAAPASAAQEPAVEVEQDDEYAVRQSEEQQLQQQLQQQQQQQQQADNTTEEIRIRRVYRGEDADDDSGSAAWVLLHSNRLAPLLLGLGGMGVLMYIVTR
jgi:pyruvate/2-oxoglutarate dehydrogenase complex dihydrolipoamide acyltransferase (E2) component